MSRSKSGFTFMELLLAVLITGLVMTSLYGLLVSTIEVKELVQGELDEVKAGALAFDLVRRDIQAACALPDGRIFFKSKRGESGGRGAGRLDFIASVRNKFPDESAFRGAEGGKDELTRMKCDICEIGYMVKRVGDESYLVRREDFYLDEDFDKGGTAMKICRRVKSFEIFFLTGDEEETGGEPKEEWDAEEEEALPFAVKIKLVIDRARGEWEEREKVFEAVVPLFTGTRRTEEDEEDSGGGDRRDR